LIIIGLRFFPIATEIKIATVIDIAIDIVIEIIIAL
jgi:hypothetical protein